MTALTKIDVAAMKKADRIVFRHYRGASQIEAIKEADERNGSPLTTRPLWRFPANH